MTWSLSRLKTFEQCAAKYEYKYVKKLPDEGYSSPQAQRGVEVHAEIEASIKGATVPTHPLAASVLARVQRYPLVKAEQDVKLDKEWKMVIAGDYWFHGIIDLLAMGPTEAFIADWKTGKVYPDHAQQGALYATAIMSAFENINHVITEFVYLDAKKIIAKEYFRAGLQLSQQLWNDRVAKMEGAVYFPPNPNYGCRYCAFSGAKGGPCRFG